MEWDNILPTIIMLLAAIGLPLALKSRKKGGQKKTDELYQHLQGIGIRASIFEKDISLEKTAEKRSKKQKSVGTIKLTNREIDSIDVTGIASQYGVNYFLDFLVRSASLTGSESKKKTRMVKKRSSTLWGKTVDIEWEGNEFLAQKLNFDYRLKDRLLQADLKALHSKIEIFPEPENKHVRIRTSYFLPAPDLFEILDNIARHIKSGW